MIYSLVKILFKNTILDERLYVLDVDYLFLKR